LGLAGWVPAHIMDLSFLKPLYDRSGPYASVMLDMTRTAEDSPKLIELRWRALREELAGAGTPRETLAALDRLVADHDEGRDSGGLAAFAAGAEVVLAETLDGPPPYELAHFGPLPRVLPLLACRSEPVPHLVAVVDRLGGEVTRAGDGAAPETISVRPAADFPVRKIQAGDLNQSRQHRAAEDTWKANAKKIAQEVDKRAADASVIVVAGNPRMRSLLLDELDEPVVARTVESRHSANVGLAEEVGSAVELTTVERVTVEVERFHRELANDRRAAAGLGAVTEALRNAQVATLLLEDHPESTERLWFGPGPADVATSATALREENVAEPVEDRADAVLARTLSRTGAELVIVPHGGLRTGQGVGALLRFTTGA
jgi:Bacterial archaeo-eukaryotic release factor family 2